MKTTEIVDRTGTASSAPTSPYACSPRNSEKITSTGWIFAAVPILHSRGPVDETETPPTARQRSVYRWVAGLMIADLLLLLAAFVFREQLGDVPLVLLGEAVALSLFAWFWWVQTFQRWDDANPPSVR